MNTFLQKKSLILALSKREILAKYKGSFIGILWSFLIPLLMLSVYTFVFSVVFKAKWNVESDSKTEFALILFTGLIFFNFFSDCISKAPSLITSNTNYVKKIVFPLEILPIVSLCSALYQLAISGTVWLLFYIIFFGIPPVTIFQLPLLLIPFILFVLGSSWLLSALGVYVRDINQVIGVVITVLMFMSPIFYPITIVPETFRKFLLISPITFMVEEARSVMVMGTSIDYKLYTVHLVIAITTSIIGYVFFMKTKKGFADVL